MFSVDNFYDFFDHHYGMQNTGAVIWKFFPHGSKTLIDAYPSHDNNGQCYFNSPCIIMHDQEPFDFNYAVCAYVNNTKDLRVPGSHPEMQNEDVFRLHWLTTAHPIFCHSEKNSVDIELIESLGFIPCHYFWHGLICRDWFRHWKHNPVLSRNHKNFHPSQRFLLYVLGTDGTRSYRKTVLDRLEPIAHQVKMPSSVNRAVDSNWSAKIDVADTRFLHIHLVAETLFETSKIHLTEKIFKAIVMRQPFVIFSAPGSLAYLRSYGFKTFDEFWDESYDSETNHDERMNKIIALIERLAAMSSLQFQDLVRRCQEITDHNARHFFSDIFENELLKELHTNMRISLEQQALMFESDPGGPFMAMFDKLMTDNQNLSQHQRNLLAAYVVSSNQYQPHRFHLVRSRYPWLKEFAAQ